MRIFGRRQQMRKATLPTFGGAPQAGRQVRLEVFVARSLRARLRGLLGAAPLRAGAGLLLPGEWAVHGVGMRRPIDVVFIDRDGCVLAIRPLRPGAIAWHFGAAGTLELRQGEAARLGLFPGCALAAREVDRLASLLEAPMASSGRVLTVASVVLMFGFFSMACQPESAWAGGSGVAPTAAGKLVLPVDLAVPLASDRRIIPGHHLAALMRDAEARYQGESPEAALADFRFIAEAAPDWAPLAWLRVGNILQRQGSLTAALEAYRQASDAAMRAANGAGKAASPPSPAMATSATAAVAVGDAGRKAAANAAILALEIAADALARLPPLASDDPSVAALIETTSRVSRALPSLLGERPALAPAAARPVVGSPSRPPVSNRPAPRTGGDGADGSLPRIDYLPAAPSIPAARAGR